MYRLPILRQLQCDALFTKMLKSIMKNINFAINRDHKYKK